MLQQSSLSCFCVGSRVLKLRYQWAIGTYSTHLVECSTPYLSRGACTKKCGNTVTAKTKSKNSAWNVLMYSKKLLLVSHSHNWCSIHSWKLILIRNLCLQKRNPHFFLSAWLRGKWVKLCFIHCLVKWSCDYNTNRLHKLQCAQSTN